MLSCHNTRKDEIQQKEELDDSPFKKLSFRKFFIFIDLGLLANLLSVAVLWKQRKMFIYKLFLAMSFADLVVSFFSLYSAGYWNSHCGCGMLSSYHFHLILS